ncbi:hypothetical protein CYY_004209 [Polysphondylium violaceum]|uniref:Threonylcarbamoyl-AMP synthase n=1 Tax=Polysphondylium violaceum TaxID=133409 RepID=A0A8J4PXC5_9MYCE|nr:hypothetical protein CYY_004209 [Polysphondylium violaceum]
MKSVIHNWCCGSDNINKIKSLFYSSLIISSYSNSNSKSNSNNSSYIRFYSKQINTTTTINKTTIYNHKMASFNPLAKIVEPTLDNLVEAGKKIKNGGLVSFPTETVYGLGANALDKDAVLSIFEAKGRPLTDPVIVHIIDSEYAKSLLELTDKQTEIFNLLVGSFWPGPLTIVAKSSSLVPMIVTAQTGYVGVRYPKHDLAQALIAHSGVPIAAPSANRFGHVSPTSAMHVFDDLGHSPITILDTTTAYQAPCKIGIESTVLKIVSDTDLVILRKGGVSERSLRQLFVNRTDINISSINKTVSNTTNEGQEAPGQLLTHYAPDIQTYILNTCSSSSSSNNSSSSSSKSLDSSSSNNNSNNNSISLKECVYIDFGGELDFKLKSQCLAYRDLSEKSDIEEAANQLFSVLRWSESVENAKIILLPDFRKQSLSHLDSDAIFDRIFRAASGKLAQINFDTNEIHF